MKLFCFIVVCFFLQWGAQAQPYETNPDFNRTRNWHFGHGVGLRFDPDTIYEVQTSIHTDEAAAVHSDANGNLLLYSNGQTIWNSSHQVIHNGNLSLGHHSSGSGSVFVIHDDNPDNIYLFNTNFNGSIGKEFSYNLLVKEEDIFRVVFKDSIILKGLCEPIAVVKADNGKDVWLVVHLNNENTIHSYRLTDKGLVLCPIISKSVIPPTGSLQALYFDMVFSSDGKYMIRTITNLPPPIINKVIEIFEFDNSKGTFEFLYSLDGFTRPYMGLGFSKNNKNIFLVERDSGLNILEFNPQDSLSTVNSLKKLQTGGFKFQLQNVTFGDHLAWSVSDSNYLVLIKNSDNIDSVELVKDIVVINNGLPKFDLPNFNKSYFHTPSINFTYKINSISNIIKFYGQDTFDATTHNWFITKQGVTPLTSSLKNPLIEFIDTGVYEIRYIATNGSRSDTLTKEVIILPKIEKTFLGSDTSWCENTGGSRTLKAPQGMHCYEWSTGETTQEITVSSSGTYIVKITTPNFCVLFDTINIEVHSSPSKEFLGNDTAWCESENSSLFLNAPNDMESYFWQDSSTGQTFEADKTGSYYVTITDSNGCFSSDTIKIFIDSIPSIPSNFLGDDIAWCENIDTLIALTAPSGNYIYNWNTGSNANQMQTDSAGIYSVMVSTIDGYCSIADSVLLFKNPKPDKPQIYQAKDTLKTNAVSDTYVWLKNSIAIGNNQDFLKLLDTGIYSLQINNEFDCVNTSDTLHIYTLNFKELLFKGISVYPNPFNSNIFIESSIEITEIRVINALGQTVYCKISPTQNDDIETSRFKNGLYIIIVKDINQNLYTYKLIKQSE